jgi:hypothetical protein
MIVLSTGTVELIVFIQTTIPHLFGGIVGDFQLQEVRGRLTG